MYKKEPPIDPEIKAMFGSLFESDSGAEILLNAAADNAPFTLPSTQPCQSVTDIVAEVELATLLEKVVGLSSEEARQTAAKATSVMQQRSPIRLRKFVPDDRQRPAMRFFLRHFDADPEGYPSLSKFSSWARVRC
jgi:hypothetical protein